MAAANKAKGLNGQEYVVRIDEDALIQMCLSGLEAYSIWHRQKGPRTRLETYGALWGHELTLPGGRIVYSIQTATVDTSAERTHDSFFPVEDALRLKRDVMTSFWPQYEFLGNFHSHPYDSLQEVNSYEEKGYWFSRQDYDFIQLNSGEWLKHNYRVGLVLTITAMGRASGLSHAEIDESTIQFTMGNYRLWLKAYVAYKDGKSLRVSAHDDPLIRLDCPALTGQTLEYTPFGRGTAGRGSIHKPGAIDVAE